MIDKETVEYVANLARIELKKEEANMLSGQLGDILGFIDKLKEVNVDKVLPASHAITVSNVLRGDSPKGPLSAHSVLSNAPLKREKFFLVPKIIE
ncbi:MAG: Glutamyl-tRNA(Gln) amidotransferase subunit C [Candidatus Omnitrophica bacterium ADurb.Bin205]|nr:MAG: Glutamyl-tRNA(Gln) amidotransferase subunit C [Candidatus Omnitrophica bacterium ADurb.Bin205]